MSDGKARIVSLDLDQKSVVRWSPEVEHERDVAIFDLLEDNHFQLVDQFHGPYRVVLSVRESSLIMQVAPFAVANSRSETALSPQWPPT